MRNIKSKVDQLGLLLDTMAEIAKEADVLKAELRDEFRATEQGEFLGREYKATVYTKPNTTVDYRALLAHLNVSPELVAQFTRTSESVAVRVTDI